MVVIQVVITINHAEACPVLANKFLIPIYPALLHCYHSPSCYQSRKENNVREATGFSSSIR